MPMLERETIVAPVRAAEQPSHGNGPLMGIVLGFVVAAFVFYFAFLNPTRLVEHPTATNTLPTTMATPDLMPNSPASDMAVPVPGAVKPVAATRSNDQPLPPPGITLLPPNNAAQTTANPQ